MLVANGMEIPADGLLLQGADLLTDESAMTGETNPIKKEILIKCIQARNTIIAEGGKEHSSTHEVSSPIMMSGSKVLQGEGKMVVIAVGKLSALGKI